MSTVGKTPERDPNPRFKRAARLAASWLGMRADDAAARSNGEKGGKLSSAFGFAAPPLDLRLVGRTLLHAALVGLAAGLVGAAFFAALEYTQSLLLEGLGGYSPLRANGERLLAEKTSLVLHPLVVVLLPGIGGAALRSAQSARAGDARWRRRRGHSRLSSPRGRDQAAGHLDQGAGLDLHARKRRLGRSGRADDADRSSARFHRRAQSQGHAARAPHLDGRGRRGRAGGGVSHAARRGPSGRRGALPRRLRSRGARSGHSGERHRLLGRDLHLRRVDPVRARPPLRLPSPGIFRSTRSSPF